MQAIEMVQLLGWRIKCEIFKAFRLGFNTFEIQSFRLESI